MNKKAQVLMLGLWALSLLTILTVASGHRVSMALRVSGYAKNKLKSHCLAKAGLQKAIIELKKDKNAIDTLSESWSTGIDPVSAQPIFEKIELRYGSGETFTVRYPSEANKYTAMVDEERKININTASPATLIALFEYIHAPDPEKLADNIRVFRGDADPAIAEETKDYTDLGYACKNSKFVDLTEAMLVKGITLDIFERLKPFTTVYGEGKINVNTASEETLLILARGAAKELSSDEEHADAVAKKIVEERLTKYFKTKNDLTLPSEPQEVNIFNAVLDNSDFVSDNFFIEVIGNTGKISSKITAIYAREDDKIIYWHES